MVYISSDFFKVFNLIKPVIKETSGKHGQFGFFWKDIVSADNGEEMIIFL